MCVSERVTQEWFRMPDRRRVNPLSALVLAGVSEFPSRVAGEEETSVRRREQRRPPHDHLHHLL